MKKYNNTVFLLLSLLCIISLSSCDKETEANKGIIKGAVKLTTNNIPALVGVTQTRNGERPWLWKMGWNGDKFDLVKFFYSWNISENDFVNVDLIVTENKELAFQYLTESLNNTPFPIKANEREDKPTIVGNISFDHGSNFIRDNIIIQIHAEGIFNKKTDKIAQQIDELILDSPSFFSLSKVKPVIKDYSITNNPVIERTKTLIILNVEDPNNKEIYYQWSFNTIVGLGGNITQDNDDFYYDSNSTFNTLESNEEKVTVIAINEYGFFTDSTILIQTIKE